jgi:hypothetical protein
MTSSSPVRGGAAGLVSGLVGALAMAVLSRLWSEATRGRVSPQEQSLVHQGGRPDVEAAKKRGQTSGEGGIATTKVVDQVAEGVMDRPASPRERHHGGQLVHYLFGAACGLAYGALVEQAPFLKSGRGLLFGAGLWTATIPTILPALRLSAGPMRYSLSEHAFGFLSHLTYGLATECTRRQLRR